MGQSSNGLWNVWFSLHATAMINLDSQQISPRYNLFGVKQP